MGKRAAAAAAATRIQAAFRGYNVRRRTPLTHLRVIRNGRLKLKELQARAADPVYVDKICADVMERRKLMEEAMAILLQLDGIQGVHPTVRDIRKSVNREVVQFMELIDVVIMGAELEAAAGRTSSVAAAAAATMSNGTATSKFDHSFPIRGASARSTTTLTSDNSNSSVDNSYYYDGRETLSSSGSALDSAEPLEMMDHSRVAAAAGEEEDATEEMPRGGAQREQQQQELSSSSNGRSKYYSPESGSTSGYYSSRAGSSSFHGQQDNSSDNHDFEADAIWVETPAEAALVLQSGFRGFRVRRTNPLKHLRVISEVRSKLKELCIQVSEPGFSSKLRLDTMERLKLSECITSLLLRLDSVQGVDEVVRDIRKSVTKEVFKLQDFVDSVISGKSDRENHPTEESIQPTVLTTDMVEEQEIEQSMDDSTDAATMPGAATMGNSAEYGPGTWALGNAAVEKLSLSDRDLDHFDGRLPPLRTGSSSYHKRGKESGGLSEPDQSAVCDILSTESDADQMEVQNSAVSFASIQTVDVHESAWSDHNSQAGEVKHVLEANRYCSYDNVTELEETPESLMADPRMSQLEDPTVLFVGSEDDVQPMVEPSYVQQQHSSMSDISEQGIAVESAAAAAEESSAYNHPSSPLMESLMNDFIALKEDLDSLQRTNPSIIGNTVEASTRNDASTQQQLQSNHLAELDLIAHKYNFVPDVPLPNLAAGAGAESLSTNNISIKVENDLPSDMEVEDGNDTGISTPIDYVQDSLGVEMTGAPSDEDMANQKVNHMIRVGDLIQENARLRTLLSEVMIFAEVQTAQAAAAMAKIDRLEVQIALHKKSAEIWRKRSLLARRKK